MNFILYSFCCNVPRVVNFDVSWNSAYKMHVAVYGSGSLNVLHYAHFLDDVDLYVLRQPPCKVSGQNLILETVCEHFQCNHVSTVVVINTCT